MGFFTAGHPKKKPSHASMRGWGRRLSCLVRLWLSSECSRWWSGIITSLEESSGFVIFSTSLLMAIRWWSGIATSSCDSQGFVAFSPAPAPLVRVCGSRLGIRTRCRIDGSTELWWYQCDKMAKITVQYLAIFNNENLPNSNSPICHS